MATMPLSGTNVTLMSGIPFTNDTKHTRWFDSLSDQRVYFNARSVVTSFAEMDFQRIEGYSFIKVSISIDDLWNTNYLMFQNASYNNKWFYAFVTKLEYVNRGCTKVHFQIDPIQTWMFDITFKPSFVAREHCQLWNADGTPYINTLDEGLNYGTQYRTVSVQQYIPYSPVVFLVIVSKQTMHSLADGTVAKTIKPIVNANVQPLSYYIHPIIIGTGASPAVEIGGSSVTLDNAKDVLYNLFTDNDYVNDVVSIYLTEYIGVDIPQSGSILNFPSANFELAAIKSKDGTSSLNSLYLKTLSQYDTHSYDVGGKYDNFTVRTESKLMMYPYAFTVISDMKGGHQEIKNEYINGTELQLYVKGSLGTSNKVSYAVQNYLNQGLTLGNPISQEFAVINSDPQDIPIVVDSLAAYLQGHKNSINVQKSQQIFKGLMGVTAGAVTTAAGATSQNPAMVAGGLGQTVNAFADTAFYTQNLNAKLKDIDNTPPALSKMGSNSAFDIGNNYNGLYIIKKEISTEYANKLTSYFNMYGYKLNDVKIPNLHTRQNWNYVKTVGCNITANINNDDLQDIKNMFNSGITLWHTDDMMNYSLSNGVI